MTRFESRGYSQESRRDVAKSEMRHLTAGASCQYHHPERMEIIQPRVVPPCGKLPWVIEPQTQSTLKGLHQSRQTLSWYRQDAPPYLSPSLSSLFSLRWAAKN